MFIISSTYSTIFKKPTKTVLDFNSIFIYIFFCFSNFIHFDYTFIFSISLIIINNRNYIKFFYFVFDFISIICCVGTLLIGYNQLTNSYPIKSLILLCQLIYIFYVYYFLFCTLYQYTYH